MKPFVRSAYNYDTRVASIASQDPRRDELLTDQSFKDDADINILVRRFGVLPLISNVPLPPTSEDFEAEVFDFQTAMNYLRTAQESFDALGADVRYRFANDPQRFVEFCSERDDKGNLVNIDEMRKFGLAVPAPPAIIEPPPTKVEIVNAAPPEPKPKS